MREFDVNVFDAHIHTEFNGMLDNFSGIECSLASYKESIRYTFRWFPLGFCIAI